MNTITSVEQFEKAIKENETVYIFKHSLTCPISAAAFEEYKNFSGDFNDTPVYYLAVQDSRPLSNYIAEKYDIKHESPQVILFHQEKPVWNTSHRQITEEALKEHLQTVK
ncbi:bacillithiol system redox-active protein YtxJ [Bacillaceae bacterium Marseille-Q3522]|nr:bacillithiol system redox-active protein YtxJ [Bacillaceae bacterium Marseille-Q3522]